jgi:DNA-binding CsgD family transcriptional regulator
MGTWNTLTKTEKKFYYFLANGFKQVQIALLHFISPETVRTHLTNGMKKANCDTIPEAAADFCRAGHIEKMHPDEKQRLRDELKRLERKFGVSNK